ncbi:SURF1 family protein [Lipingzhangella sp. LS1_29]|uniref:SURF1-like protein n=1 Tax=Lipingzhangella rawalii TaxID=2055835 RepID=A0ABU2H5D8_9ACTN|nr:SURF1 family protein [Lipingzhangella rawalii]MDS1270060.1 SURF1 family protein [Lipingzhangella rawalii]
MRLLSPRWLGIHLAMVLVVAGCALGAYWQYAAAKEPERDALPMAENFADPVEVATVTSPGEYLPTDRANQPVQVTGRYDADHQRLTPGLSTTGEPGFHVVAPVVVDPPPDAPAPETDTAVAVIRGWLSDEEVASGADAPPPPEGEVTVLGWLTPPQQEPTEGFTPVDIPEGHVERVSPAVLINEWPYQLFEGSITQTEPDTPQLETSPPVETPEKYEWNLRNLSYAGQWGLFAVVALAFWGSLIRREARDTALQHDAADQDGRPDTPAPNPPTPMP